MKDIFYELIKESVNGEVQVFGEKWPVGFNTRILSNNQDKLFLHNDRNLSMLYIKDEEKFFQKLEEYISIEDKLKRKIPAYSQDEERDKYKWLMMYLFAYATTEDMREPIEYIQKRIDFLKDHTFDELEEKIMIPLEKKPLQVTLEIEQETTPTTMETPKRILMQLRDMNNPNATYKLPSIYYAIREENGKKTCYIYSLLKKRDNNRLSEAEEKLQKRMNRTLFKINDGVSQTEDYNMEGEENIKDVSMSFVFALNIFISLLQRKGIEVIKVIPYLPASYLAREITASESDREEELRERNNRIQENQTNKLIRTFRRLCAQNTSLQVTSYPYENDEFLTLSLSKRKKELDNMLLEETNKTIVEEPVK